MHLMPFCVNADEFTLRAPTVQYKLINHDIVKLRWNKVDEADKYFIYRYDFNKKKYNKTGEVRTSQCRITDLKPLTRYRYAVVSVKEITNNKYKTETDSDILNLRDSFDDITDDY